MVDTVLTLDGLQGRRDEILAVARSHRARRVSVFGSVARGEAGPDSDVDFLVEFEPEASLLDQVALTRELRSLLGVGVDVVSRGGLQPRHRRISDEAVDL
jgi:predicted nucleotidyltransferase